MCMTAGEHVCYYWLVRRTVAQHVDTESAAQQIFCCCAARVAGGLSVGPIYEIGLSVTTLSD